MILGLWAAVSLGRAVIQSFSPTGGNDLYTYWYAGHFIREGKDLYRSFIQGELPVLPVHYLDRQVDRLDQVIFPGLVPAPASPPLAFYLMLPLAFLSWSLAKAVWLGINFLLLAALPFLLTRFFSPGKWLPRWEFTALAFCMLGLTSTRFAAASGQITFLILALMLLTVILAEKHPWFAGLSLGLALSKYSLAIGLAVLFLFFEPKWRVILTAFLVQLTGLMVLLVQTGSGIWQVVREYAEMLHLHANMEGIHLAGLFPNSGMDVWIGAGLTLALAVPLILWRYRMHSGLGTSLSPLTRCSLVVSLSLWSLLVVYHRAYDAMLIVMYFYLIVYFSQRPQEWGFSTVLKRGILLVSVFALLLLMIPSGNVVRSFLPAVIENLWGRLSNLLTTLILLAALGISLFMLFLKKPEDPDRPLPRMSA